MAGMIEGVDKRKHELRARIREDRLALGAAERRAAGAALSKQLSALVSRLGVSCVSCFLPTRTEPDTRGFLNWAQAEGVEALLPSSREDGLLDWIRPNGEGVVPGAYGIEEPLGERFGPESLARVDLMLVPAAAVDLDGHRLGWGRGYFDRALAALGSPPPVYAVVYDHEVLDRVPVEAHDAPVDGVVTPARVIGFGAR